MRRAVEGYTVIARRYRPRSFEEVVGQEHVAGTLQRAIAENRVAHAYVFSGQRGVGKTSLARIFAKALNCIRGPTTQPCQECGPCRRIQEGEDHDVVEIDAASNRGAEDARALRESARYAPLESRFKIYILDEAHMLTNDAFNTLLKILEEPPPHLKFLFATTELHKMPKTILSRCQCFAFARITTGHIARRLEQVAVAEGRKIRPEALRAIAEAAGGSMRDGESILDQLLAFRGDEIDPDDVARLVGATSRGKLLRLLDAIRSGEASAILPAVNDIFSAGVDPEALVDQILQSLRTLLVLKALGKNQTAVDLTDADREEYGRLEPAFAIEPLLYSVQLFLEARRRLREGVHPQLVVEVSCLKAGSAGRLMPITEAIRIVQSAGGTVGAEPRGSSGTPKVAPAPPRPRVDPAPQPVPRPGNPVRPREEEMGDRETSAVDPAMRFYTDRWKEYARAVGEATHNPVFEAIVADFRPISDQGGTLAIRIPSKFRGPFHRDKLRRLEGEFRPQMEGAAEKVFGKRLTLRFEPDASVPGPVVPIEQDPTVQRISRVFQGIRVRETE